MKFSPPLNYPPPAYGLPAPDPFAPAAKPKWNRRKRSRTPAKSQWYCAYTGDEWKKPYGRNIYRFNVYHYKGMLLCRIVCTDEHGNQRLITDSPPRLAAPTFKSEAIKEGLRPIPRPNKYRTGPSIRFWDWPSGFMQR